MSSFKTYLKIMLLTAGCLFVAGLYAAEEGMEEERMAEEEGMLEEVVEELPPLYTSEVEIGVGFSTVDSFKFGEYNGLEDDGAFAIGNIKLRKNAEIDDADNNYWEFFGTNLGLDSRNIFMEYSHDGIYGEYSKNSAYSLFFEYDQIPHNQFEDGRTPFNGAGTTNQTLPAGWVPAQTTAGLTTLLASLKTVQLETERQRFGGGFKWKPLNNWQVKGNYRHEDKEGSDPFGAIFGNSGGNPRGSIIAIPINYDVDEFNISLSYTGMKAQVSLDYHLSLFDNNDTSVFFANPFSIPFRGANPQWAAGSGFPGVGQLGLFPDNQAHQINLSGGYNFTPKTRATATVSYSRWLQDETFLPFSNIHAAAIPLPRTSLDGDIATLFANINLFTRVSNKLDLKLRYTYDDRDNKTPRDIYVRIAGDSQIQNGLISASARQNWTYDLEKHKVELDGNYRITPRTRMSLGYEYETKDRNFSEVADTDEHTGKIKISSNPIDYASGWIKYSHSVRNGSTYVSNQPFLDGHNPAYLATLAGSALFENDFLMRKFHLADRDRDMLSGAISAYPIETLTFSLSGSYKRDDYDDTQIGLQESKNTMVTLDLNYQPNDIINAYAWISRENYQYDQRGFRRDGDNFGPGDNRFAEAGEDFWTTDTEDKIHTFGTGIDWNVIEDKFNLKLDFTYSQATTEYTQMGGPALTGNNIPIPLPTVDTDLLNVSLTGDYKVKESMTARVKYMYENFSTTDFTLDGVNVNTVNNMILLGNSSPQYDAHVFGLSLIYRY